MLKVRTLEQIQGQTVLVPNRTPMETELMKTTMTLLLLSSIALAGSLLWTSDAQAQCTFFVRGQMRTAIDAAIENEVGESEYALADVTVRVQGAQTLGGWRTWGNVRTDNNGNFWVAERFGQFGNACRRGRFVRVQVRLTNPDLDVQPSPWYTVYDSKDASVRIQHDQGFTNLGTFTFDGPTGVGNFDLGDWRAHRQSNIWALYQEVFDYFEGLGPALAFARPVQVHYPWDNGLFGDGPEASHAIPNTGRIFIIRNTEQDDFDLDTLVHELMHVWTYHHDQGDTGLLWDAILSGDTHEEFEPNTNIAFHEAWAEYAQEEVVARVFEPRPDFLLSFDRQYFEDLDLINDVDDLEHNEDGWMSLFRTLTARRLHRYDYGGPTRSSANNFNRVDPDAYFHPFIAVNCQVDPPELSFEDLLQVMIANPGDGYPNNITRQEMNMADYLQRVMDVHELEDAQIDAMMDILDFSSESQPRDILQCRRLIKPFPF